jgi:cell division cycle protein 37
MKQRSIHEQRFARNQLITQLEADLALNAELTPRIHKIANELKATDDKPAFFSRTVERLKTNPDPAAQAPGQDSYDTIIYHLLLTVYDDVKKKGIEKDSPKLGDALQEALGDHLAKLEEDTKKKEAQIEEEKKEKAKKITTEDIHEGFDSKV